MRSLFLCAVVIVISSTTAFAGVIVQTTFDSDRQDWSPAFPAGTGTGDFWKSTGGDPGGTVRSLDRSSSSSLPSWYFTNNTTFNGDRSAAYNGTLTFDLRDNGSGAAKTNASFPGSVFDVRIFGQSGLSLIYVGLTPPTGDAWTSYSLTLNESAANWHVNSAASGAPTQSQFQSVLGNITGIDIRGDYWLSDETTWLDNVALNTPATVAVPEPSSMALLGLGFALAACRCRRSAV